jgi:mono/diheme cytochrome c family protein
MAAIALLAAACQGQVSREPPVHPNLNMDFQHRVDPQEAEPFFEDQRGARIPPEGTVATTLAADDVHLQADDHLYRGIVNGAFATSLPASVALNAETLARGQERYGIYCTVCHGATGVGNGIAVARGVQQPPSYHEQRLREQPVGYIYSVITNGIRTMSPYKAQIPAEDRWLIAAYVKALQVSQQAPIALVPSDVAASKGWR